MGSSLSADFLGKAAPRQGGISSDFLGEPKQAKQPAAFEGFQSPESRAEMRAYLADRPDMLAAFNAQYPEQPAPGVAGAGRGVTPASAYVRYAPNGNIPTDGPPVMNTPEASPGQKALGSLEVVGSVLTAPFGMLAAIANTASVTGRRAGYSLAGIDTSTLPSTEQAFLEGMQAGTYQPRTAEGQSRLQDLMQSHAMQSLNAVAPLNMPIGAMKFGLAARMAADAAKRKFPMAVEAMRAVPDAPINRSVEPALKPRLTIRDGKIVPVEQAAPVMAEVAGEARPVAPAAPTAPAPKTTSLSQPWRGDAAEGLASVPPELQASIIKAQADGTLNPAAARRQIQAATLDVPVRMSKGHATGDARILSEEMNGRAGKGVSVTPEFLQQQAKDLAQNLDVRRQLVAPDVVGTDPIQHGQALIDSAKKADLPERAAINQAYEALTTAAGGDLPIDGAAFVNNAETALKKKLKSGAVPSSVRSVMDEYKAGRQMTFEEFETLRTDLAQVIRDSGNGSERAAAKIIRTELENLPLTPEAAQLKPLADKARKLNKARADKLEADPAYAAAVEDTVPLGQESPIADKFVDKYLIGGPRANIATFQKNLAGDPLAKQTMAAATVDFLKAKARADVDAGKFNAASYNNTLQRVGPKLNVLVDAETAGKLQQVGDVAGYVTIQPRGSYVNNSNTLVGAAGDAGAKLARSFMAIKTLGASEGVIAAAQHLRAAKGAKEAVAPGAGVNTGTKLSDLGKP